MSLLCKYKYRFYMEAGFYSDNDKMVGSFTKLT